MRESNSGLWFPIDKDAPCALGSEKMAIASDFAGNRFPGGGKREMGEKGCLKSKWNFCRPDAVAF